MTARNMDISIARYNSAWMHVFEPCDCGDPECKSVMVQRVDDLPHYQRDPFLLHAGYLQDASPLARELIEMAMKRCYSCDPNSGPECLAMVGEACACPCHAAEPVAEVPWLEAV